MSRRAALQLSKEFKHFDKCKDLNTGEKGAEDAEVGQYVIIDVINSFIENYLKIIDLNGQLSQKTWSKIG